MSSNINEESKKTIKPTPLSLSKPLRTVSAQPTINDTTTSSVSAQAHDKSTDLKLNINATVFVPKEKRTDIGKPTTIHEAKENLSSSTVSTSSLTNPTTNTFSQQSSVPLTGYTCKIKFFKQNSLPTSRIQLFVPQ
jgi:hypothetical protein